MKIDDELKQFTNEVGGSLLFDYDLKKNNWFNIGGKTKRFFKPESLKDLSNFIKKFGHKENFFILGAGSNILLSDNTFDGTVIKMGKTFSNISILSNETIIAGSAVLDKKLAEYAMENNIGGLEFLSCIPGTVGGGLKMNSGCYKKEFKDILISVQAMDKNGNIITIPSSKIKFGYRETNLDKDLIFLSASFKGKFKEKEEIKETIKILKAKKELAQPTKIKTGGSTFKNPINQTNEKVWKLIKRSVDHDKSFGDAKISEKHCNFFINSNKATSRDMKNLIKFVQESVKSKTGFNIETEIIIID